MSVMTEYPLKLYLQMVLPLYSRTLYSDMHEISDHP